MSSHLVRQALDLVDPEDCKAVGRKSKRATPRKPQIDYRHSLSKRKSTTKSSELKPSDKTEENVKRLLKLSGNQTEEDKSDPKDIKKKIIERALKRKPLLEHVEVTKKQYKSVLFPEETFEAFEEEYFCS